MGAFRFRETAAEHTALAALGLRKNGQLAISQRDPAITI
jgi:hypothetical protein